MFNDTCLKETGNYSNITLDTTHCHNYNWYILPLYHQTYKKAPVLDSNRLSVC
jgi:hypothetical protein